MVIQLLPIEKGRKIFFSVCTKVAQWLNVDECLIRQQKILKRTYANGFAHVCTHTKKKTKHEIKQDAMWHVTLVNPFCQCPKQGSVTAPPPHPPPQLTPFLFILFDVPRCCCCYCSCNLQPPPTPPFVLCLFPPLPVDVTVVSDTTSHFPTHHRVDSVPLSCCCRVFVLFSNSLRRCLFLLSLSSLS